MTTNQLTEAEVERLGMLVEAASGVLHATAEILRDGYDVVNLNDEENTLTNREVLEVKLGYMKYVLQRMQFSMDFSDVKVTDALGDAILSEPRRLNHN